MNLPEIIIVNHTDLHSRIMQLNNVKEEQELQIKRDLREIGYSMQPGALIKSAAKKFSDDSLNAKNLATVGLTLGKDFLITKLFGRQGSLKGFLTSLVAKKATDYVIKNHYDLITKGLSKLKSYLQSPKARTF